MIALGFVADWWCAEVVLTFVFFFKPCKVLHERIPKNQSHILITFVAYRRVVLVACKQGFLTL